MSVIMPDLFAPPLLDAAKHLLADCERRGILLVTAESCTGGLLAALLTEIPGSSAVFERGFVTYSNASKTDMLGVDSDLMARYGAVSAEAARAMAEGALARSAAHLALSITGVAGPGGGSAEKPVGLVHIAAARKGGAVLHEERRFGDIGRGAVRLAAVTETLALASEVLEGSPL